MRSPENVLKSLSEKAKNKEYRYERLYRNLYNPEFYLLAYQNIATSQGSMTAGADGLTLDGKIKSPFIPAEPSKACLYCEEK